MAGKDSNLKIPVPTVPVQIFGGEDRDDARRKRSLMTVLAASVAVSLTLLWLVSQNIVLVGAMLAGLGALFAFIEYAVRRRPALEAVTHGLPDWAVTRSVADADSAAIAISDRAGRLLCANANFTKWFDGLRAPPDLGLDDASRELLVKASRAAWRDGLANVDGVKRRSEEFAVQVSRSGIGDEYLLWRISPKQSINVTTRANEFIAGRIGRALSLAGVMGVVVSSEGRIRAANSAFAVRATGSENSNIASRDAASFLRLDEKGRVFFELEGKRASPVRLLHIPLEPNDSEGDALLLAIDDEGVVAERSSALKHVEHMLSTLPLGLALVDRDGRFLFANESFTRVVGIDAEALPPYPGDLVIAEDKSAVSDSIRRYAAGQAHAGDIAVRMKDRPEEVIALSIAGVRGLGEAAVLLGLKDNSEETKLKRQVAQATKMQAIGQLAGGVAHDFNNILTAILGYCDLMLLRHAPGDSDYDDIQQIKNNSNRAASLTRQLLAFSRQQTLRPQILQLPDVVADVSQLLKRLLGEKVRLEVQHGRVIGPVRADPGQLEQVIINLGVNARDAMPDGGTLTLETRAISQADVRAMRSEILPIGDYALLAVSDTGSGISRENLGKIFEPFFTTKEVGKGTGLGLSTVYGIVKQSGGFIFAESSVGEGTRFDIYLPTYAGNAMATKQKTVALSKPETAEATWGQGRILLVEDEDMVRAVAERALVRQGYTVETACDGEEALAKYAEGQPFDLVLTDVVMPNMDGPAMARQVRAQNGKQAILFMSGYAEEQLRQSINLDNVHFLPKPFSVQQIAEAVRDALKS
jgi:two-component system, cell cycle sensor histidine kinase and response regulator CckA